MSSEKVSMIKEGDILDGLLQGGIIKRKAEDQLFKQYAYLMKDAIKKLFLSGDEAFDAYSDTVLTVIEAVNQRSFERRSSLKTYLYQIFHNKCVDLIRKKSTNKYSVYHTSAITDMLHTVSDSAKLILQKLIEKTDLDLLKQKMKELSESCRQLLMLSAEGHPDKEVAVLMDYKSADVVKTSRLRCLEKLRQLYSVK